MSRRETSWSEAPSRTTGSKSFCIGHKGIRRPWPIYFDAARSSPLLQEIFQYLIPPLAAAARNEKSGLPQQVRLDAADLSAGRRIRCDLLQCSGKLGQAGNVRTPFQVRCLALKVLRAGADLFCFFRRFLLFAEDFYAPFVRV